ncbi:MAG: dipeptide ABC transporter ATP-binding protein [Treponema sp.]|jgi:oligopeptide/dipeptide ABC transporter ATP-binding protein|nr:dipeptide ABC transporter ATP-binding protein [Treponema sp.]
MNARNVIIGNQFFPVQFFQDTHKPLRLEIRSYKTAWAWLRKLRRAMVRPGRDRLSGIGGTVSISSLLDIQDLSVSFNTPKGPVKAIDRISFSLERGEMLGLLGRSGAGKTVTAQSILRLHDEKQVSYSGKVIFEGRDMLNISRQEMRNYRGGRIALICQDAMRALNPVLSIGNQIVESLKLHRKLKGREASETALDLLSRVDIPDPSKRFIQFPHELSGGMRQRTLIAMALSSNPRLLIADEPATALDLSVQARIMELIAKLRQDLGMAVLFITHDRALASNYCNRTLVLEKGRLAAERPKIQMENFARVSGGFKPGSGLVLEAQGLSTYFKTGKTRGRSSILHAVEGVDLCIREGETLGLVGESGCGKSTLARTLVRLLKPDRGSVFFQGRDISKLKETDLRPLRREMQMVFQDPYSSLSPHVRLGDSLEEALKIHRIGENRKERLNLAIEALERAGLGREFYGRYPRECSGGQLQRLCIARALLLKSKLLILDEPVASLDSYTRDEILRLFTAIQREEEMSALFISHDLRVLPSVSRRVAVMYLGRIVEHAERDELFRQPLHPYTEALLSAIPGQNRERIRLNGEAPSPLNPPSGCVFQSRCPKAIPLCRKEAPSWTTGGSRGIACHLHH